jgi:hypothetical protein
MAKSRKISELCEIVKRKISVSSMQNNIIANSNLDSQIDNFLYENNNSSKPNLSSSQSFNDFGSNSNSSKDEGIHLEDEKPQQLSFLKCRKCKRTGHTKGMCKYVSKVRCRIYN